MKFYRNPDPSKSFSPEVHTWLAQADGLLLFPMKSSDRWSPSVQGFQDWILTPAAEVPVEVRRKAGQRLGGYRRATRAPS